MTSDEFLLPPDFDAQMNVALEHMDTSTDEGKKAFALFMIQSVYSQMVEVATTVAREKALNMDPKIH